MAVPRGPVTGIIPCRVDCAGPGNIRIYLGICSRREGAQQQKRARQNQEQTKRRTERLTCLKCLRAHAHGFSQGSTNYAVCNNSHWNAGHSLDCFFGSDRVEEAPKALVAKLRHESNCANATRLLREIPDRRAKRFLPPLKSQRYNRRCHQDSGKAFASHYRLNAIQLRTPSRVTR